MSKRCWPKIQKCKDLKRKITAKVFKFQKYRASLILAACLYGQSLWAAAIDNTDVKVASSSLGQDHKTGRKIVTRPVIQDKMDRRNFHVLNAESEGNLLNADDDDDSRTITYSYLNYGLCFLPSLFFVSFVFLSI